MAGSAKYYIKASILISTLLFSIECQTKEPDLFAQLAKWMQGSFNSSEQASKDNDYFNIHLHMKRIWPNAGEDIWLYVEQAADGYLEKPYRQRVYQLKQLGENRFASVVYTFDEPLKFAGAWQNEDPLSELSTDDLTIRKGCTVYLQWDKSTRLYSGSTDTNKCQSNLRGATYATSEVTIHSDKILSWDRGYDADDKQVWGAEKGGYIFLKQ